MTLMTKILLLVLAFLVYFSDICSQKTITDCGTYAIMLGFEPLREHKAKQKRKQKPVSRG